MPNPTATFETTEVRIERAIHDNPPNSCIAGASASPYAPIHPKGGSVVPLGFVSEASRERFRSKKPHLTD